MPSRFINGSIGKRIRVCGIVAAVRTARSGRNGQVCFITLSDEDGLFELTLSPDVYERNKSFLASEGVGLLWSEGNPQSQYDAVSINAECVGTLKRVA